MESESDRFGLSSSLYAVCDSCGMKEFLATGYHNATDTVPRSIQGKDINRRIVYASYEMGVGKEGIAKLCEILNMPFSMSKLTWYNHEDVLFEAHKDVVFAVNLHNDWKQKERIQEQHKNYTLAKSQARKRDENMRLQKEGTTYEAGAFNF